MGTNYDDFLIRNFKSKQKYTDIKNVMPLPPALAARLAKRGIISKKSAQQAKPQEEEVFAESYDDHEDNNSKSNQDTFEKVKYLGYPCCPNKWNVYHECSLYCQNHWSNRRSNGPDPDSEYAAKYKAMMSKFGPLPENWTEKWDPGCQRHYYWCSKTDKVSWLPPGHPKAKITEAASHVREMIQNQIHMEPDNDDFDSDDEEDDEHAMDLDSDMDSDHEEEERRQRERDRRREEKRRDKKKTRESGGGRIDPMDPSSYSDVPRGSWSSGLEADRAGPDSSGPG